MFDIVVWPVEDLNWNTTTWVESITESIGGNGANTATTLALLGVPVQLVSVVGDDEQGRRLIETLRNSGVDVSGIGPVAGDRTPCTTVLVHQGGDRKFLHRPGVSRTMSASSVVFPVKENYTHFHLANPFALATLRHHCGDLMRRAKESGLTTSVDTGWDSRGRWMEDLAPALAYTDLLFANDLETRLLGGSDDLDTAVELIQSHGVGEVVVKTGSKGCSLYSSGERADIAGYEVHAIDSTGAGDCFAGAFLAGIALGWPRADCARLANATGAMNVEQIGAIAGVRNLDETLEWMRSRAAASTL